MVSIHVCKTSFVKPTQRLADSSVYLNLFDVERGLAWKCLLRVLEKILCVLKCDHRWGKLISPSCLLRILADDSKTMSRNQDCVAQCLNQLMPKRFCGETFLSFWSWNTLGSYGSYLCIVHRNLLWLLVTPAQMHQMAGLHPKLTFTYSLFCFPFSTFIFYQLAEMVMIELGLNALENWAVPLHPSKCFNEVAELDLFVFVLLKQPDGLYSSTKTWVHAAFFCMHDTCMLVCVCVCVNMHVYEIG